MVVGEEGKEGRRREEKKLALAGEEEGGKREKMKELGRGKK